MPNDVATAVPIAAPIAAATPVASPAPQPAASGISAETGFEIAGAAGFGLLALLGIGAAMRRRSRRTREEEFAVFEQPLEPTMAPAAVAEPIREPALRRAQLVVATSAALPVGKPIAAPATSLPDNFDLSRFGAHVQAAYRGPTEDNPSLSLKHRLRRASAMDQMARRDGTEIVPAVAATAPVDPGAIVSKMTEPRSSDSFMLGNGAPRPGLRPVTQH